MPQIRVHTAKKIVDFDPNWAFPDCISSLESPMATKWYTKLEVALKRCPVVFQGHLSNFKVTPDKTWPIVTQIGRFWNIGQSQSNPSDLPCLCVRWERTTCILVRWRPKCPRQTRRLTHATTIPGGQNWPRVKGAQLSQNWPWFQTAWVVLFCQSNALSASNEAINGNVFDINDKSGTYYLETFNAMKHK